MAALGSLSVLQWESYKLCESFMAGCAVLLPDLEAHGLELPVMPVAGEHYVAICFEPAALRELRDALATGALDLERIGNAGRAWALEHYSPAAWGRAFAQHVDEARRVVAPQQAIATPRAALM